ncbi:23S rRNA (adenine1618-N6)-methyltransferase [Daejeonella rubra]|uniref:Ribosomal RNA large subunit methyltransferase F n=1 Tax=Daejeonella rubra TaxID=990371 RepID=A0A1G9QPM2_9SPHI|nr:23S rRNA (adenine(1618)-N(6))-methyltransferase RlmF [Daejeonella rubra]SDM12810.1 23S rRNA (adenine1618-N6)-methyltransferase [Daejeonella rubra]
MPSKLKSIPDEKDELHPRNKHRGRYNFPELIRSCPELANYVNLNQFQDQSVDFTDLHAVKTLNRALLIHFYGISLWDIPEGFLCPPIPGRADYIHYVADLLAESNGFIPTGKNVKVLDIGVGANCVYPLIGHSEYGWSFVGSEIDHLAIRSAKNIVDANGLSKFITIRKQRSDSKIFTDLINPGEKFNLSICNPPFHSSMKEASEGSERKWKNLGKTLDSGNNLNFGGKNAELWCEGGEERFLQHMITESENFAQSVGWFTSLISKKETLPSCYRALEKVKASDVRTISMQQGQKTSRILAWKIG